MGDPFIHSWGEIMLTTDYSKIASRYDNNNLRLDIPKDDNIGRLYASRGPGLRVLDLACGTGNYLGEQVEAYRDFSIEWFGLDKCPEMLGEAIKKAFVVHLVEGDACALPFENSSFDYVKIRFAFHHFLDKEAAVDEAKRVLKPGGELSIFNLAHDYSKDWWAYRYFPSIEEIDSERFLSSRAMFEILEKRGFSVQATIRTSIKRFYFFDLIAEAENRDMSQLNLISEREYQTGLARLRDDAKKAEYLIGDIAFMDCLATSPDA